MNIADRIQHLRKVKGISQEELADKIGVSRQAVSKWESEQSVPDIDKVASMSDFFDVTTDYIFKGIETERQANNKTVNATIFVIVATVLNFIGLIIASAIWYEEQVPMAIVIGLVFMALGCMVFCIGVSEATKNAKNAKRAFWKMNVWVLLFMPLSFLYNVLFTGTTAPYPLVGQSLITLLVFCSVYVSICLGVVLFQIKQNRR